MGQFVVGDTSGSVVGAISGSGSGSIQHPAIENTVESDEALLKIGLDKLQKVLIVAVISPTTLITLAQMQGFAESTHWLIWGKSNGLNAISNQPSS